MRTSHEDKSMIRQDPFLTRAEHSDELRRFEDARRGWRSKAEQAADPTPAEQKRLDDAMTSWEAARLAAQNAIAIAAEAKRALAAASGTKTVRAAGGVYDEVPRATLAELAALEEAARTTAEAAEAAADTAHRAQRRYNEVSWAVAATGGARRQRLEAEASADAFLARKRAAGAEVNEAEVLARFGLRPSRFEQIRVIFGRGGRVVRARTITGGSE